MGFFFVFMGFLVNEFEKETIVTFMRDLVRQGPPTFDLTFPISGPNKARAINIFFVSMVILVKEFEKIKSIS